MPRFGRYDLAAREALPVGVNRAADAPIAAPAPALRTRLNRPSDTILHLQRTIGNRRTGQWLANGGLERSFDHSSALPGRRPASSPLPGGAPMIQRVCTECEEEMQRQLAPEREEEELQTLRRQPEEEEELQTLRRQPEDEEELQTLRRQPEDEEELQTLRRKPEDEEELLQGKSAGVATASGGQGLARQLRSRKGNGRPLDTKARVQLEPAMGADLSHVRIHTDASADHLSRQVSAEAFTTGNDVFFRSGRYQPGSSGGLHLLAHEITHTFQQASGGVDGAQRVGDVRIGRVNDPFEREADRVADATVARANGGSPELAGEPGQRNARGAPGPTLRRRPAEANAAGGPFIQRKPTVDRSVRDWEVSFDPQAILFPDVGSAQVGKYDLDSNSETFQVSPAMVQDKAFARLLVDMKWKRKTGGGGGTNPGLIAAICDEAAFSNNLVLMQICNALKAGKNLEEIIRTLTPGQLCSIILDNSLGNLLPGVIGNLPFIGGILGNLTRRAQFEACRAVAGAGIEPLREAVLTILNALTIPGFTPPRPKAEFDKGKARAKLDTRLAFNAEGDLILFGAPAIGNSQGVAAELVSPIEFSRDQIPPNGHVSIAPMIRSRITTQRPNGEQVTETNTFQRFFELDLRLPEPVDFCCATQLKPFKIGSDRFMDEDGAHQQLFDWMMSLNPAIRQAANRGEIPFVAAGRASKTGSQSFNLQLSEKRAARVRQMLQDFAGSDAHLTVFAFGKLLAATPACPEGVTNPALCEDPEERRVDVKIEGKISPDKLAGADNCGFAPQTPSVCADPILKIGG